MMITIITKNKTKRRKSRNNDKIKFVYLGEGLTNILYALIVLININNNKKHNLTSTIYSPTLNFINHPSDVSAFEKVAIVFVGC